MRIDCSNATECAVSEVMVGDTFYFNSILHIKVAPGNVDVFATEHDRCFIVALDTGTLKSVKADARVILANTRVVAFNGRTI